LAGKLAVISFMTYAELERWALSRNWGKRRLLRLRQHVRNNFTVHPVSGRLCRWWAEVSQRADNNGRPISTADAWHAAVAMRYGIPLVTHNPGHFAGVDGLTIIAHWQVTRDKSYRGIVMLGTVQGGGAILKCESCQFSDMQKTANSEDVGTEVLQRLAKKD
jgi:predicted nucleic acid-binding protein